MTTLSPYFVWGCLVASRLIPPPRGRLLAFLVTIVAFTARGVLVANAADFSADEIEFFERKVRPILSSKCFQCHGREDEIKGGLALTNRESLLRGGDSGPAVTSGSPDQSLLIEAIRYQGDLQMPPSGPLAEDEVASLTKWVRDGVAWPDESPAVAADRASLWSLQPITDPAPPPVQDPGWATSQVDRFILARIEAAGLRPAKAASKTTLLRRVYFDLIGLPPAPDDVRAFLADTSPEALAKVVDQLLASPHYGERWGRHWLDLVRFAESNGFEFDTRKPNAYRYRDYVIEAFNRDLPYDVFLREMIAGDLLDPPRLGLDGASVQSPIGSGALWFQEMIQFVVDWPKARADELENQIDTLGKSVLGMTLACARCHDHKSDPITTEDYYSIAGTLMSSTNVQQCIDSKQQVRRIEEVGQGIEACHEKIESIHDNARTALLWTETRLAEARNIDAYLAAVRDVLLADEDDKEAALANAARHHNVSSDRLSRWLNAIAAAIARDDTIYAPWMRLGKCPPSVVAIRGKTLASSYEFLRRKDAIRNGELVQVLADFEEGDLDGWSAEGAAFRNVSGPSRTVSGYHGERFVSSFHGTDALTGRLVSPRIKLDDQSIALMFRVAGAARFGKTCVNILVNSQSIRIDEIFTIPGNDSDRFVGRAVPLSPLPFQGREAFIEVVDDDESPGGHIMVDDFRLVRHSDDEGYRATLANSVLIDLLRDPAMRSHTDFDRQLEATVVDALDRDRRVLAEIVDGQETGSINTENARLHHWRRLLDKSERREFLAMILQDDSPLLSRDELEALLDEPRRSELQQLRRQISELELQLPSSSLAMVARDLPSNDVAVQRKGDPYDPGRIVPRGYIAALRPADAPPITNGSGRLELAGWIASAENPLVSRVIVNRLWQHHFGRGLVATVDDFGVGGERPSHPELLDYLAARLVESGWSLKAMHRLMLLSSTYQQDSQASPSSQQKDPDNTLLSNMSVRRLEAECIRDAILKVSGTLDPTLGGPSVPAAPAAEDAPVVSDVNSDRRSIYLEVRRNYLNGLLTVFDFPRPYMCVGSRPSRVVPEQSLALMNHPFIEDHARRWAKKIMTEDGTETERLERVYLAALGRTPTKAEIVTASQFMQTRVQARLGATLADEVAQLSAWEDLVHVIFNLAEFTFIR